MPVPLQPGDLARYTAVLAESREPAELRAAALALAESGEMDPTLALARALRGDEFLARLDPPVEGSAPVVNLSAVFRALANNPSAWSGRLCELLYGVPAFQAVLARINPLLGALAAIVPTTESGAQVFRAAADSGFAEVIAPLLLRNASPIALQVFEELIAGPSSPDFVKVDMLHRSLLPVRAVLAVIESCARLWNSDLTPAVRAALAETLYDYQSRYWFGPAMHPPEPPDWNAAETAALERLIGLSQQVTASPLSPGLADAVAATREELSSILRGRA